MSSAVSKFILSLHIIFSVGWLGAFAGFLALNNAGLTTHNEQVMRSAYFAMNLIGWYVILPSCLGSLLTGLVQSLGTKWGLFKYYWILIKFLLTISSTFLLLLHMQTINMTARIAFVANIPTAELRSLGNQLLTKATAALLVLVVTTIISVYKPWGKIQYAFTKKPIQVKVMPDNPFVTKKTWGWYLLIGFFGLLILFIVIHMTNGGLGHHH